ncbi:MAG: transposase, partial [Anaerolineae bacterium]|nr:transposase [Anaerolineae bacterium]
RTNLRQVSYALFCCSDGQLPLYYDIYAGNGSDAKQFRAVIGRFQEWFGVLSGSAAPLSSLTVVFDKGNNSAENFALLDQLGMHFVGSMKLDEHKDLMRISNEDTRFQALEGERWQGAKAFRLTREIAGKPRTLVMTYNPKLFQAQWLTLQNDLEKALAGFSNLQQRLLDRRQGLITGGRAPQPVSIEKQCRELLKRQHLKRLIQFRIEAPDGEIPKLHYQFDEQALHELANTWLGKTLLVTTRSNWSDAKIVEAYRSQYQSENIFKQMQDPGVGNWWPLQHWTDSKIRVHGLYCTIALLWRALIMRRLVQAGLPLSLQRAYAELNKIKQVINLLPKRRGQKTVNQQVVFTEMTPLQNQILQALQL